MTNPKPPSSALERARKLLEAGPAAKFIKADGYLLINKPQIKDILTPDEQARAEAILKKT